MPKTKPAKTPPKKKRRTKNFGRYMTSNPNPPPPAEMSKAILNDINEKYSQWFSRPLDRGGVDKVFSTPQALLETFKNYVDWTISNPWPTYEWKGKGLKKIPKATPFSIRGFTLHVGIHSGYLDTFEKHLKKDHPHYDGFSVVINIIRETIFKNKFDGASIGAFNARFMSYELGMGYDQHLANGGASSTLNVIVVENEHEMLLEEIKAKLEAIDEESELKLKAKKK